MDKNVVELEQLWDRAARAGYTHVLLADSKFSKLGDMDARYFRNVERLKSKARELKLEVIPAVFPIGYSNDILWHNPNLVEALPVRDVELEVQGGIAVPVHRGNMLKGGDFSDLKQWSWKDPAVQSRDGALLIENPRGENARIVQKLSFLPFHQYHLSIRLKLEEFKGKPEVKILGKNGDGLDYNTLETQSTQDWKKYDLTFNSLGNSEANLYVGSWGAREGRMWADDAFLEETAFVNLVRRPGTPLLLKSADGRVLKEGEDYERLVDPKMGTRLWKGSYDTWHEPPSLKVRLPDGARLKASFHHAVTVYEDQANICVSEPETLELLRDQARRMHALWQARGYMMSHDEIRVLNWCEACRKRGLDAGRLLADNVSACAGILREINPGAHLCLERYVRSEP